MAEAKLTGDAVAAFGVAVALTLVAVAIDSATVAYLVAPMIAVALLYAMWRAPLRYSLMVLMFCAFTLENPEESPAAGLWKSPLFTVGAVVLTHLNNVVGSGSLSFSGMDLMLVSLLLVTAIRKLTNSKVDALGNIATPRPLRRLALLSLAGTVLVWTIGMLRGGDYRIALWQVNRVVYLPIVFFLFSAGLRGPKDYPALARVLLAAATVRAGLAIYVSRTVTWPIDPVTGVPSLPYATSHHDSILFASAVVLLVSLVLERAGRHAKRTAVLLLPVLLLGMLANNRRMVWVQIGMVFLTVYLVTPPNPMKRKIRWVLMAALPVLAVYMAMGWDSDSSLFRPVHMVRSVVDPQSDVSTQCREIENFDLISTIRQFSVAGTGYGNGYLNVVQLPELGYPLERYIPHNSILGLWAYCGYFGYTMMTLLWVGGVYFGVRAYHMARRPVDRTAALMTFGTVLIYMVQCWGDMGLGSWTGVFTMAPALAVAGKLAVAVGAWGEKAASPAAQRGHVAHAARAKVAFATQVGRVS
jgi:hypothetical protein